MRREGKGVGEGENDDGGSFVGGRGVR